MKIRKNTIIVTVGPSNCGKSYWCNNYVVPVLSGKFESVHYISTDDLRRYVLNKDLDKYDRQMWAASNQAFDLLFAELEAVISYPCNQEIVVVDSTALNTDFRKRVVNLAKKHNYTVQYVLFDYDVKEYFGDGNSDVIKKHYNSFKRDVLPVISREIETKNITRIKSKSKFDFEIEIEYDKAKTLKLDSESVCIIGDVHSSKSFFEMVDRTKDFDKIVLIGDVIDKGREEDCEKIIDHILADSRFLVVKGNHEHFFSIYDKAKNSLEQEILDCYFGHTQSTNEDFKAKIKALIDQCYDFIEGPNWIATHSPCELKYLGKTDTNSLKQQRNFRHTVNTDIDFINKEQNFCHKYHIWGHIPLDRYFINQSNIGIDTGAICGNFLTGVYFNNGKPKFIKVHSSEKLAESDLTKFNDVLYPKKEERKTDSATMSKAKMLIDKGVEYIVPTMCPADKSETELESLESVVKYYKENGVTEICAQIKHMGSNFTAYIYPEVEKCYGTTKNGFKIDDDLNAELADSYKWLIAKIGESFEYADCVVISGELMPWRALGAGLIDKTFYGYGDLANAKNERLKESGFFDAIKEACFTLPIEDFCKMDKDQAIEKHGHHIYSSAKNVHMLSKNFENYDDMKANTKAFLRQVDLYGHDCNPYIVPFAILKIINKDGTITVPTDNMVYNMFNDYGCEKFSVNDLDAIKCFQETLNGRDLEGLVVKPANGADVSVAPYFKVRNPEYLRIVYGPDYLNENKLTKLHKKKYIRHKLRDSINQNAAAQELLAAATYEEKVEKMANFLEVSGRAQNADPRF